MYAVDILIAFACEFKTSNLWNQKPAYCNKHEKQSFMFLIFYCQKSYQVHASTWFQH